MTGADFWKGKRVVITGGLGFIGSRIAENIGTRGAMVVIADRKSNTAGGSQSTSTKLNPPIVRGDIGDYAWVSEIVNEHAPDYVFHLAGQSITEECVAHPLTAFDSNITGTWNLLEACRRNTQVKGVVVASSYKVYGHQSDICFTEDSPLLGLQPYDAAKVCADVLARSYYASFGLPVAVTRCANTFGEGDRHSSRIIPAVIHAGITDTELVIRSDGRGELDFVYLDDVVTGYLSIAEQLSSGSVRGQAFNLGSGTSVSVLELVRTIGDLLGRQIRYRVLKQPGETRERLYLDISKAKELLRWQPAYTLKDALAATIAWHSRENSSAQ